MELDRIKLRICQDLRINTLLSRRNLYFDPPIKLFLFTPFQYLKYVIIGKRTKRRDRIIIPLQKVRLGLNLKKYLT